MDLDCNRYDSAVLTYSFRFSFEKLEAEGKNLNLLINLFSVPDSEVSKYPPKIQL
jgi:hypothetical protein